MKCFICLGKGCQHCNNTGKYIVHNFHETNERYTPRGIIECARRTMGTIDVDPASSAYANKVVKATEYYTREDNGLKKCWNGNIWLNPPYGLIPTMNKGLQELFIVKLVEEYNAGRVKQAIGIFDLHVVHNPYFDPLWKHLVCFYNNRINFYTSNSETLRSHGNVITYMGDRRDTFISLFSRYGHVVQSLTVELEIGLDKVV